MKLQHVYYKNSVKDAKKLVYNIQVLHTVLYKIKWTKQIIGEKSTTLYKKYNSVYPVQRELTQILGARYQCGVE